MSGGHHLLCVSPAAKHTTPTTQAHLMMTTTTNPFPSVSPHRQRGVRRRLATARYAGRPTASFSEQTAPSLAVFAPRLDGHPIRKQPSLRHADTRHADKVSVVLVGYTWVPL